MKWVKGGIGRRSSTVKPSANYGGYTVREMRRLNGVGRPPAKRSPAKRSGI